MARDSVTLALRPAWLAAARYVERPVAAWIAAVVEDYLRNGAGRFIPRLPLRWRLGSFQVRVMGDLRPQVHGLTAGPFGIYKSRYDGFPNEPKGFTLSHLPSGGIFVYLNQLRACKRIAAELAALRLRLTATDPNLIILGAPDAAKVPRLIMRYRDADLPERMRR